MGCPQSTTPRRRAAPCCSHTLCTPVQALLFNGNGFWKDCKLNAGGVTTPPPTCAVTNLTVPPGANALQPEASAANPGGWVGGCARSKRGGLHPAQACRQ